MNIPEISLERPLIYKGARVGKVVGNIVPWNVVPSGDAMPETRVFVVKEDAKGDDPIDYAFVVPTFDRGLGSRIPFNVAPSRIEGPRDYPIRNKLLAGVQTKVDVYVYDVEEGDGQSVAGEFVRDIKVNATSTQDHRYRGVLAYLSRVAKSMAFNLIVALSKEPTIDVHLASKVIEAMTFLGYDFVAPVFPIYSQWNSHNINPRLDGVAVRAKNPVILYDHESIQSAGANHAAAQALLNHSEYTPVYPMQTWIGAIGKFSDHNLPIVAIESISYMSEEDSDPEPSTMPRKSMRCHSIEMEFSFTSLLEYWTEWTDADFAVGQYPNLKLTCGEDVFILATKDIESEDDAISLVEEVLKAANMSPKIRDSEQRQAEKEQLRAELLTMVMDNLVASRVYLNSALSKMDYLLKREDVDIQPGTEARRGGYVLRYEPPDEVEKTGTS